ncbi:MAG TPA: RNA polymerase sigma-70 factor [Flavisolibacter sp.]|nr:RNA polymerase sigma-70 factor [Flavisolibacter sp.]
MVTAHKILPDERLLFARMSTGDQQAFSQIFHHYSQRIYGFILSKTKSEELTEEIVQDVFIKLWNKRDEVREIENYGAYILTMAANKTYDFLRKMASEEKLKQRVWLSIQNHSNITEETLDFKQSQALLNEAIEQLPPQRKKVFLLSRQEGLSHNEIAERMNLSPKTVNNHLVEALRFIKEYLKQAPGASFILLMILLRIKG